MNKYSCNAGWGIHTILCYKQLNELAGSVGPIRVPWDSMNNIIVFMAARSAMILVRSLMHTSTHIGLTAQLMNSMAANNADYDTRDTFLATPIASLRTGHGR